MKKLIVLIAVILILILLFVDFTDGIVTPSLAAKHKQGHHFRRNKLTTRTPEENLEEGGEDDYEQGEPDYEEEYDDKGAGSQNADQDDDNDSLKDWVEWLKYNSQLLSKVQQYWEETKVFFEKFFGTYGQKT